MQQRVRNCQKTVNNCFKLWGILKQRCHHSIPDHGHVFHTIVVITQISIDNGEILFQYGYRDPPHANDQSIQDTESDLSYSASTISL